MVKLLFYTVVDLTFNTKLQLVNEYGLREIYYLYNSQEC